MVIYLAELVRWIHWRAGSLLAPRPTCASAPAPIAWKEFQPADSQVSVPVDPWIGVALCLRPPGAHGAPTQAALSSGRVCLHGLQRWGGRMPAHVPAACRAMAAALNLHRCAVLVSFPCTRYVQAAALRTARARSFATLSSSLLKNVVTRRDTRRTARSDRDISNRKARERALRTT